MKNTSLRKTAARLLPGFVNALHNLGTTLLYLGRAAEAAEQFEQVLKASPQSAETWLLLGDARSVQGRPDEAAAAYGEALRVAPPGSAVAEQARARIQRGSE